jgi:hypothetical protein
MNPKILLCHVMVGGQLFLFHVMQPSDCACPERQIAALPAGLPQQPENLPDTATLLLERDSAGLSSTVVSAISTAAYESLARVSAASTVSMA